MTYHQHQKQLRIQKGLALSTASPDECLKILNTPPAVPTIPKSVPAKPLIEPASTAQKIAGVLHFDGSCWPNPGPNSQCGFVLKFETRIIEKTIFLGQGTNNTAEYFGLLNGLRAALDNGVTDLECYGDSQLVIYGVRRFKLSKKGKPHLEALKAQAIGLAKQFHKIEFIWVPREENAEADSLSIAGL